MLMEAKGKLKKQIKDRFVDSIQKFRATLVINGWGLVNNLLII